MSQDPDLKNIRQSKGLTLDDIARRTRIRSGFLEAIEEGNYHLLPEKYYAETFIKVYAETLGVDSAPLLARYWQSLEKPGTATRKEPQPEVKSEPKKRMTRPALTTKQRRLIGWAISLAIIMTLIVFILYPRETIVEVPAPPLSAVKPPGVSEKETPAQEEQLKSEAVEKPGSLQEKADVRETPEPKKEAPPAAGTEESKKKYTLRVEAKELTWLRIKEDRQAARQYLLQPGEQLSRQAAERFEIDIGNAGGVELYLQGKSLGAPGKRGEVLRLVLPEE
jgi:cytoskeletal protein RodZ